MGSQVVHRSDAATPATPIDLGYLCIGPQEGGSLTPLFEVPKV